MGLKHDVTGKMGRSVFLFILFLLFSAACGADSSSTAEGRIRYSAVYRNLIRLEKEDYPFSWNDLASDSHLMDILSFSVRSRNTGPADIFIRGKTGWGDFGQPGYSNRFYLDQGHAEVSLFNGAVQGRAFLRERVFGSQNLLFQMVSSDSPYLDRNGEGFAGKAELTDDFAIRYTTARLSSSNPPYSNGGLPWMEGETELFNHLRAGYYPGGPGHVSACIIETRRLGGAGNVTIGVSAGARFRSLYLITEFAQSAAHPIGDLTAGDFEGIDPHGISWGAFSPALPSNSTLAAELHGIEIKEDEAGEFEFLPGYRYVGSNFDNPHGGIGQGMVESYLLSVWRHSRLAAMIRLRTGDIYYFSGQKRYLYLKGSSRFRLKGGFGLELGVLSREQRDPSLFLTLEDDNEFSGLRASFRMDGISAATRFSFITDGWVNIFEGWNLRSTLYLKESYGSRYSLSLEYRPSERFVFTATAGSFDPDRRQMTFNEDWDPVEIGRNRQISISTRVWLGSIRD